VGLPLEREKSYLKMKWNLGMACHTPPLEKSKETRRNAITHAHAVPSHS